jgi:hypothetical protein
MVAATKATRAGLRARTLGLEVGAAR